MSAATNVIASPNAELRCAVCGAVAQASASGKRIEIPHDFSKHVQAAEPATKPIARPKPARAYGDDE